jgi:hypothetical protein
MKLRHVYLFLFVGGTMLPYALVGPWLLDNGLNAGLFFAELFSTRVGGSFGLDLIVSTTVLLIFAWAETSRMEIARRRLILAAVFAATFGAGVSSGFPLFLYLRQWHFDKNNELPGNARDSRAA